MLITPSTPRRSRSQSLSLSTSPTPRRSRSLSLGATPPPRSINTRIPTGLTKIIGGKTPQARLDHMNFFHFRAIINPKQIQRLVRHLVEQFDYYDLARPSNSLIVFAIYKILVPADTEYKKYTPYGTHFVSIDLIKTIIINLQKIIKKAFPIPEADYIYMRILRTLFTINEHSAYYKGKTLDLIALISSNPRNPRQTQAQNYLQKSFTPAFQQLEQISQISDPKDIKKFDTLSTYCKILQATAKAGIEPEATYELFLQTLHNPLITCCFKVANLCKGLLSIATHANLTERLPSDLLNATGYTSWGSLQTNLDTEDRKDLVIDYTFITLLELLAIDTPSEPIFEIFQEIVSAKHSSTIQQFLFRCTQHLKENKTHKHRFADLFLQLRMSSIQNIKEIDEAFSKCKPTSAEWKQYRELKNNIATSS